MSGLSERSKQKPRYFEQRNEFEASLGEYSFGNLKITPPKKRDGRIPLVGLGGVPLSWNENRNSVFVDIEDSHTLVIGPTGSKKSRLVAMPMVRILGSAGESIIVCDPKAEIFNRTASFLKEIGYEIGVLNLRNPNEGSAWNPLEIAYDYYRSGDLEKIDKAYEYANDIITNLVNIDFERNKSDPFWDNSFSSFALGLIILLFKICDEGNVDSQHVNLRNLIELRKVLFQGDMSTDSERFVQNNIAKYAVADKHLESLLLGIFTAAPQTRMSILATFDSKMRIFLTKTQVTNMLSSKSTLPLNKLITEKTAIFLILPDEKTSFHSIVSLFVKQSYEYFIDLAQSWTDNNQTQNRRINYVLDEFSSLPTIKDFPAMITAARSRNIRFNIFVQSKHQMILRYNKEADTILTNCKNWVFLTSREILLLQELSALAGEITDPGALVKQVLPVSDLQRLDKDLGEAVIMRDRSKPYLSTLADIEVYETTKHEKTPIQVNSYSSTSILDFNTIVDKIIKQPSDAKIKYESYKSFKDDFFEEISNLNFIDSDEKLESVSSCLCEFIESTTGVDTESIEYEYDLVVSDTFVNYESSLLQILSVYLINLAPPDEQNMAMISELLNAGRLPYEKIYDFNYNSDLDRLFELAKKDKRNKKSSIHFDYEFNTLKEKLNKSTKSLKLLNLVIESLMIRCYPISVVSESINRLDSDMVNHSFASDLLCSLSANFEKHKLKGTSREQLYNDDISIHILTGLIKSVFSMNEYKRNNYNLGQILSSLLQKDVNFILELMKRLGKYKNTHGTTDNIDVEREISDVFLRLKFLFDFYHKAGNLDALNFDEYIWDWKSPFSNSFDNNDSVPQQANDVKNEISEKREKTFLQRLFGLFVKAKNNQ